MSSRSDPDIPRTLYIGLVSVILVFVVIVALQVLFYRVEKIEIDRKTGPQASDDLSRLRAAQIEQINNYRWLDRKNNVVAIPIEQAMELVVKELAADTTRHEANHDERLTD